MEGGVVRCFSLLSGLVMATRCGTVLYFTLAVPCVVTGGTFQLGSFVLCVRKRDECLGRLIVSGGLSVRLSGALVAAHANVTARMRTHSVAVLIMKRCM